MRGDGPRGGTSEPGRRSLGREPGGGGRASIRKAVVSKVQDSGPVSIPISRLGRGYPNHIEEP